MSVFNTLLNSERNVFECLSKVSLEPLVVRVVVKHVLDVEAFCPVGSLEPPTHSIELVGNEINDSTFGKECRSNSYSRCVFVLHPTDLRNIKPTPFSTYIYITSHSSP